MELAPRRRARLARGELPEIVAHATPPLAELDRRRPRSPAVTRRSPTRSRSTRQRRRVDAAAADPWAAAETLLGRVAFAAAHRVRGRCRGLGERCLDFSIRWAIAVSRLASGLRRSSSATAAASRAATISGSFASREAFLWREAHQHLVGAAASSATRLVVGPQRLHPGLARRPRRARPATAPPSAASTARARRHEAGASLAQLALVVRGSPHCLQLGLRDGRLGPAAPTRPSLPRPARALPSRAATRLRIASSALGERRFPALARLLLKSSIAASQGTTSASGRSARLVRQLLASSAPGAGSASFADASSRFERRSPLRLTAGTIGARHGAPRGALLSSRSPSVSAEAWAISSRSELGGRLGLLGQDAKRSEHLRLGPWR